MCDPLWPHGLPGFPVLCYFPEFTQTHIHWVSDAIQTFIGWIDGQGKERIIFCPLSPLLSPSPPAFDLSQHQGLSQWVSSLHQVVKVLELRLSISSSNEYSRLVSFRIDWSDLLAVQGTLKSLLQHHSSNIMIFWHSAFFMVQHSHPYMTTGKSIALTRWISKMSSEGNYDVLIGWANLVLWLGPKVRCGFTIMNGISHIFHNCLWS